MRWLNGKLSKIASPWQPMRQAETSSITRDRFACRTQERSRDLDVRLRPRPGSDASAEGWRPVLRRSRSLRAKTRRRTRAHLPQTLGLASSPLASGNEGFKLSGHNIPIQRDATIELFERSPRAYPQVGEEASARTISTGISPVLPVAFSLLYGVQRA